MSEETYNGWTNRETWAVALHINNDQGWQESVHEAIREARNRGDLGVREIEPERTDIDQSWKAHTAGEIIRENVETALDPFGDSDDAEALTSRQAHMIRDDIGSMWRVNWTELGASFLEDIGE